MTKSIHRPVRALAVAGLFGMAAVSFAGVFPPRADAAIECRGEAQVIAGQGLIITPYCEDHHLAQVARAVGSRYTFEQIRSNPNTKLEVCKLLRGDIRAGGACAGLGGAEGSDSFGK